MRTSDTEYKTRNTTFNNKNLLIPANSLQKQAQLPYPLIHLLEREKKIQFFLYFIEKDSLCNYK